MLPNRALAPTTFLTGPEDSLATADVYEIQSDKVINDTPSPISVDEDALADELRGGQSMVSQLPMLTSDEIRSQAEIATEWKTVGPTSAESSIGGLKSSVASAGGGFIATMKQMGSSVYNALGGVSGIKALLNSNGPSLMSRVASGGNLGIPGLAGSNNLSSLATVLNNKNAPQAMQALLNAPIPTQLGAYATNNGVTARLPNNNLTQSYQMGSLVNNVVPGSSPVSIVDKDMTARLISAFAVGGMSSGMPNSFSTVAPLAGGDNAILAKSGQLVINYAAGTGNIKGMGDVVDTVGASNVVGMGPSVFTNFSKNYHADVSATSTPSQNFTEVTQTFSKIDPDWMHAPPSNPAQDYSVVDISMATEGSGDFKSMMQTGSRSADDTSLKCFSMTNMFDLGSPEQQLGKQFPMTATSIKTNTGPSITTLQSNNRPGFNDAGNPAFNDAGNDFFPDSGNVKFNDTGSSTFNDTGSTSFNDTSTSSDPRW